MYLNWIKKVEVMLQADCNKTYSDLSGVRFGLHIFFKLGIYIIYTMKKRKNEWKIIVQIYPLNEKLADKEFETQMGNIQLYLFPECVQCVYHICVNNMFGAC